MTQNNLFNLGLQASRLDKSNKILSMMLQARPDNTVINLGYSTITYDKGQWKLVTRENTSVLFNELSTLVDFITKKYYF